MGETIRESLIVLTSDLKIIKANRSFYGRFHVTPEEIEGRFIYSIGDHAWDIPASFLWQSNGFFDKLLQAQKIK
jgi:PAS domain-containing protein